MKHLLIIAALAVAAPVVSAPVADASTIQRACMKSDRKAANRRLCGCIQQAADATLSRSEQKLASRFFKDPHRAQEIRQSDNRSHEVFWKKYKNFGATAQAYCS